MNSISEPALAVNQASRWSSTRTFAVFSGKAPATSGTIVRCASNSVWPAAPAFALTCAVCGSVFVPAGHGVSSSWPESTLSAGSIVIRRMAARPGFGTLLSIANVSDSADLFETIGPAGALIVIPPSQAFSAAEGVSGATGGGGAGAGPGAGPGGAGAWALTIVSRRFWKSCIVTAGVGPLTFASIAVRHCRDRWISWRSLASSACALGTTVATNAV